MAILRAIVSQESSPDDGDDARQRAIAGLLQDFAAGSDRAAGDLFPLLYDELRRLASAQFGGPGASPTLQPTALVHEVWLRIARAPGEVRGREHFLALAARAMRQVLVDHARRRDAEKRGGAFERITLDERVGSGAAADGIDFLALDDALARLAQIDERAARGAELRLLGGLSSDEIAVVLDVTSRTVQTDWRAANAWLTRELS